MAATEDRPDAEASAPAPELAQPTESQEQTPQAPTPAQPGEQQEREQPHPPGEAADPVRQRGSEAVPTASAPTALSAGAPKAALPVAGAGAGAVDTVPRASVADSDTDAAGTGDAARTAVGAEQTPCATLPAAPAVVFLHGLPLSASAADIVTFLSGCQLRGGAAAVHFCNTQPGRSSSDAFVELETAEDAIRAVQQYNMRYLGTRWIEVRQSNREEMDRALLVPQSSAYFVRLRGLPFDAGEAEIRQFFSGTHADVVRDGARPDARATGITIAADGIRLIRSLYGRASGEAFVMLPDAQSVEGALARHQQHMGRRYVEVFRSSYEDYEQRCRRELLEMAGYTLVGAPANAVGGWSWTPGMAADRGVGRQDGDMMPLYAAGTGSGGPMHATGYYSVSGGGGGGVGVGTGAGSVYAAKPYERPVRGSGQPLEGSRGPPGGAAAHPYAGAGRTLKMRGLPYGASNMDIAYACGASGGWRHAGMA